MFFFILKQTLSTNPGESSDKKEEISGVPQGAGLGSILFLIYVYDLPISLTSNCTDIFVDDTTIGTSSHSIDTLVETLFTDLQNVLSWCNSNNMSLNVSKTKLIYISHLDTNSIYLQIVIMI